MFCASGANHTISLSDYGIVYAFGRNNEGQLGLRHTKDVSIPTPIFKLPKIGQVSCGAHFTMCLDLDGNVWSFGQNEFGQLGTGNTTNFTVPQKIQDIPLVHSVTCGYKHTCIITIDANLWSCGHNGSGQLCLGHTQDQSKFRKTNFSKISRISLGDGHSIIQNDNGEIYSCGSNKHGQLGLGYFNNGTITPTLIPNLPPNIVQFVCGYAHNLFLDAKGNVFSVGFNYFGQLGLGHNSNDHILNKISNIPPIQSISCICYSSYLIDYEGNVWSFGYGGKGQLGLGKTNDRNVPTKIENLKSIQQVSYGCYGNHVLFKNSHQIYTIGSNSYGQLGLISESLSMPKELQPQYSSIWGGNKKKTNQWKRRCSETIMNWSAEEITKIEIVQSKINQTKRNLQSNNNNKIQQEFPQNSFESWNEVKVYLKEILQHINSQLNQKQSIQNRNQREVETLEKELEEIQSKFKQLQERKKEIEENLLPKAKQSENSLEQMFEFMENNYKQWHGMLYDVSLFCNNENEMNKEVSQLFYEKEFEDFDCLDLSKVLWKMDLIKYQPSFEQNHIDGKLAAQMIDDWTAWKQVGVEESDYSLLSYYFQIMKKPPGYSEPNLCVCCHTSLEKIILVPSPKVRKFMDDIKKWKEHKLHLKEIAPKRSLEKFEKSPLKKQKLGHNFSINY